MPSYEGHIWRQAVVRPRRPLLFISGEKDHAVPWAIVRASYDRQKRNPGNTEVVKIPTRGDALTIDRGWTEVADLALVFLRENAQA